MYLEISRVDRGFLPAHAPHPRRSGKMRRRLKDGEKAMDATNLDVYTFSLALSCYSTGRTTNS
jgi:hypothetical protein